VVVGFSLFPPIVCSDPRGLMLVVLYRFDHLSLSPVLLPLRVRRLERGLGGAFETSSMERLGKHHPSGLLTTPARIRFFLRSLVFSFRGCGQELRAGDPPPYPELSGRFTGSCWRPGPFSSFRLLRTALRLFKIALSGQAALVSALFYSALCFFPFGFLGFSEKLSCNHTRIPWPLAAARDSFAQGLEF